MNAITSFFTAMYSKVRVVLVTAVIAAIGAGLDSLAGWDWTSSLGPWAVPIGLGVAWLAAWWKKEHQTPPPTT